MKKVNILLNSFEKVERFVNASFSMNDKLKLESGNYTVNGKSLLGIFNLDLSKPITMVMKENVDLPKEFEIFMI